MAKEFGDFQTNLNFAEVVCNLLKSKGINPKTIIEPTCGEGNFIVASLKQFPNLHNVIGIELQKDYVQKSNKNVEDFEKVKNKNLPKITIIQDDIFSHDFKNDNISYDDIILLIGNPPWVTNSELEGKNLPKKSNFKKTNGLDAITGKANFDISEYILLHLLKQFKGRHGHMAFLCKTHVVKNIIQFLPETDFTASNFCSYLFNAKKEFNVIVDACLFVCDLSGNDKSYQCKIYNIENPDKEIKSIGWVDDKFVSNTKKYEQTKSIDGVSPLTWRSGVKHDCSDIMELEVYNDIGLKNKLNEILILEEGILYPFLKSSYIKGLVINHSRKKVIITQKKTGEDTQQISQLYPKTWQYLNSHKESFDNRKSIIYKKNPPFSIFGIGDYSFKSYKIAISGLYKDPHFALLIPEEDKCLMVDDGCYFVGFDNVKDALIMLGVLNSKLVKDFLDSIAFIDAKRPYTKDILMRINVSKALQKIGYSGIIEYLNMNNIKFEEITKDDFNGFVNSI
jgi:methylase of polypeptide subunit release factors